MPFGSVAAVRAAIAPQTVAIMVEPIQGEGGVRVPPHDYLTGLRALADEHNLLLILDEIQTGVGRTGYFFGFEAFNDSGAWLPDIVTLGKGLGGGVPISATLANERTNCFDYGDQGGTYNGNALVTAVGNAVVDVVANSAFLAAVRQYGARLEQLLVQGVEQHALPYTQIRGAGLLWAIEFVEPLAEEVCRQAFECGLLINPAQPNVVRLMPPLRLSVNELVEFSERFSSALGAVASQRATMGQPA